MRHGYLIAACMAVVLSVTPAHVYAACAPLPHTISNGDVADATKLMANLNSLHDCTDDLQPGGSINTVQIQNGAGGLDGVGPLTNGQVLIGSTGAAPVATTLTPGPGISITNAAGGVTISSSAGSGGLYSQVMSTTPTSAGTGLSNWLNQGSATVSDTAIGMSINAPGTGGDSISGRYEAVPSQPYRVRALIAATRDSASYSSVGIGWYDGTFKLETLFFTTSGGGAPYLAVDTWSSVTSHDSVLFASNPNAFSQPIWLQIEDDGTSVSFAFSNDGANYLTLYSHAKSSGYLGSSGYSNLAFFVNPTASQTIGSLMSWSVELLP